MQKQLRSNPETHSGSAGAIMKAICPWPDDPDAWMRLLWISHSGTASFIFLPDQIIDPDLNILSLTNYSPGALVTGENALPGVVLYDPGTTAHAINGFIAMKATRFVSMFANAAGGTDIQIVLDWIRGEAASIPLPHPAEMRQPTAEEIRAAEQREKALLFKEEFHGDPIPKPQKTNSLAKAFESPYPHKAVRNG